MKVKEWIEGDGGLVLDGNIRAGAIEAFDNYRYIEAFELLQTLIEFDLLNLIRIKKSNKNEYLEKDRTTLNKFFSLKNISTTFIVKSALENGVISEKEKAQIERCYDVRNKIVHRIIFRSRLGSIAHDSYFMVKPTEAKEVFDEMLSIEKTLSERPITLLM